MEFNFLKLIFTLKMRADIADPYLLFSIRTDFAEIFRNTVGCDRQSCGKCSVAKECPYDQIFSQAISQDSSAIKRFQKPPLPFAFDLPILTPETNKGSEMEIGLTLTGRAVNHVLHFKNAVESMIDKMGRPGSGFARVVKMEAVDYLGNRMVISQEGCKDSLDRLFVLSMDGLEKTAVLADDSVTISFDAPLRIIKDGRPIRELSFPPLAMALLRRISALAYYYCFMELDLDFKWLSRQSQQICICNNGFRWTEWDKGIGGIIGSGTFTGPMVEFYPFLLLGEFIHVGKGASYGLGSFRLEKAG